MSHSILSRSAASALLALSLAFSGCSGDSAPPPQKAEIAAQARTTVQSFLETARKAPKRAGQEATILLESLEAMATEYGEPYTVLLEKARDVEAKYKANAPKGEIDAALETLEQQVTALPGA